MAPAPSLDWAWALPGTPPTDTQLPLLSHSRASSWVGVSDQDSCHLLSGWRWASFSFWSPHRGPIFCSMVKPQLRPAPAAPGTCLGVALRAQCLRPHLLWPHGAKRI